MDDTLYWLRVNAVVAIGVPTIVSMWTLTGPKNCGKSFLVLPIFALLGSGPKHYTQFLTANWLSTPLGRIQRHRRRSWRRCRAAS